METFFALPHPQLYLLCLAAAFLLCAALLLRKAPHQRAAAGCFVALALLLGAFFARFLFLIVKTSDLAMTAQWFFAPEDVREFAFSGAVLGVIAALWASQKLFKIDALWDAAAVPCMLMVLIARLAEIFVPFGVGDYVDAPALWWVPLCMPDGFGSWLLSIFLFEALWALFSLVYVKKQKAHRFFSAVLCYHVGQMFFESLRSETLRYGFVRVSQVIAACVLFILLCIMGRGQKGFVRRVLITLLCIALYVGFEFGLDRLPWPHIILRTAMVATSAVLFYTIRGDAHGQTPEERTTP